MLVVMRFFCFISIPTVFCVRTVRRARKPGDQILAAFSRSLFPFSLLLSGLRMLLGAHANSNALTVGAAQLPISSAFAQWLGKHPQQHTKQL